MKVAEIYCNGILAGLLTEENRRSFIFRYEDSYFNDISKPAVSLTLSKIQQEYRSEFLFPFFSNMAAEGANLAIQSRYLKIDEADILSLLGAPAKSDSIGAISVKLRDQK